MIRAPNLRALYVISTHSFHRGGDMQKSGSINRSSNTASLKLTTPQQSLRRLGLCSGTAAGGQQSSPVVFPEKRRRSGVVNRSSSAGGGEGVDKGLRDEHRIDIGVGGGGGGDEKSDLLGYVVYSGKLALDKRKYAKIMDDVEKGLNEVKIQDAVDAKLTSKALVWGSHVLPLDEIVSVSYSAGLRYFTVHAYPKRKPSCGLSCLMKKKRNRKDFCFVAGSAEDAVQWVGGFADQQCFVNCLPHPMVSSKKQASYPSDTPPELIFRCKSPPKMLVILNPRSGHGRSTKVFHDIVEPIFELAGFNFEVVKTTHAGHARKLASTVDISSCPDGIVCVGGDGIINEVLNGLLNRENQKEGISIPIGIIPAGSDNSLVWTVLGVRDPVSAAIAIVKGGLTATDVFAVEWVNTGLIHFGLTVSYYGFVSDVLELSEKYQKRFGPLRYFVAGFLKFLCLPKYSFEVEYLPASIEDLEGKASAEREVVDISDLYTDVMGRKNKEGLPRASSLSSIDSIMTPSQMSGGDLDTTCSSTHASTEPSEYVRGLDSKSKRLSSGRRNVTTEPEVIHPQLPLSTTPNNRSRTRSKSRMDKGWTGSTVNHDTSRCSWANAPGNDREDISSTVSDPGPIWDAEPNWDTEPSWDVENRIELPGPPDDADKEAKMIISKHDEDWVATKGKFLGIMVCNHACRTVQSSQVVAPKSEPDDNTLDLILVRGSGRLRLMRFFILLQLGRHLKLPYVEYVKVKSINIKPGKRTHNGCGIDGELFPLNGQVTSSLLQEQCRLIGCSANHHV